MTSINDAAPVSLSINGSEYELAYTIAAALAISRSCGGMQGAIDGVRNLDPEKMAAVILHASGLKPKDAEKVATDLLAGGMTSAVEPMLEYLVKMATGGMRATEGSGTGE